MQKIDKDDFADYIFEYCNGCGADETVYCRTACPVYKAAIFVNTYNDEESVSEDVEYGC